MIVDIPNVGPVEFPDSMTEEEINLAAKQLYEEANKPKVTEKESPEFFGSIGGVGGAVTAASDVIFSKGRPVFRNIEKLIGLPQDPNLTPAKQRKFLDPAQVTERAIATREAQMAPTATEKYMTSGQFTSPEAKALYYGTGETGEYSGARKAAARAIETEKMFPGIKVLPGETPIALPEGVTSQVEAERAEAKRLKDIEQQKEINQLGAKRARLLDERNRLARLKGGLSSADVVGSKVAAPILGGYELGSQGAQAYNRLTREDLQASDVAAGAANIVGAGAGASAMLPGRLRLPKAVISTGLGRVADILDVRNPRKEKSVLEEEEKKKAKGGLVHLAKGGSTAAWQRSEGKNPEGGLNAVGRASYKRETGGELKPPVSAKEAKKSPKKASRRKSFCSRMKGMKSKLTSAKTANDPDSRINKALRKWDC